MQALQNGLDELLGNLAQEINRPVPQVIADPALAVCVILEISPPFQHTLRFQDSLIFIIEMMEHTVLDDEIERIVRVAHLIHCSHLELAPFSILASLAPLIRVLDAHLAKVNSSCQAGVRQSFASPDR